MLKQINGIVLTALLSGLFAFPAQAHEWRERRHNRHKHYHDHHRHYSHHYPPHGKIVVSLPGKHVSVIIGGQRYYHCDGVYYRRDRYRYVVVPPPQEIVVTAKNEDYRENHVDAQYFTVNIPNSRGGYTPVTLKRAGDGFVGPQGEFYPEFPNVEQLKPLYVKSK